MAIFSNTKSMYDVPACEGYNFETCGHYDALMESLEDDLAITKAMHAFDMAEITGMRQLNESYGNDDLQATLEAASNNIFATIKEKLMKLWAKIKAFFGSIFRFLTSFFKSGEEFIKANDGALKVAMGEKLDFKMKTFKYNFDAIVTASNKGGSIKMYEAFKTLNSSLAREKSKEEIDKKFEALYGDKKDKDYEELLEKNARKYRGLSDSEAIEKKEIKIDNAYFKDCYDFLESDIKNVLKDLKDAKSKSDEAFTKTLATIKDCENVKAEGATEISVYAAKKADAACTKYNKYLTDEINDQIKIAKEASTEAKKVCLKAITFVQRSGKSLKY